MIFCDACESIHHLVGLHFFIFLSVARGDTIEDQIIVGTPGTLLDWCVKFKAVNMQSIRVFVLDEADVMISQQGHQDQSIRLQR